MPPAQPLLFRQMRRRIPCTTTAHDAAQHALQVVQSRHQWRHTRATRPASALPDLRRGDQRAERLQVPMTIRIDLPWIESDLLPNHADGTNWRALSHLKSKEKRDGQLAAREVCA